VADRRPFAVMSAPRRAAFGSLRPVRWNGLACASLLSPERESVATSDCGKRCGTSAPTTHGGQRWCGTGTLCLQDFKTCAVVQPTARSVRLRRRSVTAIPRTDAGSRLLERAAGSSSLVRSRPLETVGAWRALARNGAPRIVSRISTRGRGGASRVRAPAGAGSRPARRRCRRATRQARAAPESRRV